MTDQTVTIQVFGQLAESMGTGSLQAPVFEDTGKLKNWLSEKFPALLQTTFVIAVDKKISPDNIPLQANSVIALLPPFSGG